MPQVKKLNNKKVQKFLLLSNNLNNSSHIILLNINENPKLWIYRIPF